MCPVFLKGGPVYGNVAAKEIDSVPAINYNPVMNLKF